MAQAQGGTAGSSVGRGNGSMSANGGRSQGSQNAGKNDSRGPGGSLGALAGKSDKSSSSGNKSTSASAAKSASSPAATAAKSAPSGGIMGGLVGAVQSARAAKSTTSVTGKSSISSNIGNAVTNAFGGMDQSKDSFGAGVSDNGSVSNSVGAMNTPQAKAKAESQMNAFKSGYRDQANNSMTGAAFGTAGTVGSAVGAGIGKVTGTNYASGTDEANTAARGAAYANQNGLSSTARGLGSMAAGILGGPVGSAIASLALGGTSYAMQRNAFPSAFDGQQDKGITSGMAMNNGSETMRESGLSNGPEIVSDGGWSSGNDMVSSMLQAAVPEQTAAAPAPFDHASDYTNQRNSIWGMNLGGII